MGPTNEQRRGITPWVFSESMYMINGKDFRLGVGRNYLRPVYDADLTELLLMTGRQVEKSTTLSVKIANNVLQIPFSRNLYVAPLNEQVKTFSKSRLDKLFRYSKNDLVARRYKSAKLVDQVFHKEFTNGSEVYMRNCFEEADNIRGLSIDDICIDEVQDIQVDALPVIMETQTRSKRPHLFLTGTPKTFSNTIQQKWDASTQADWVIKCPACRREQVLSHDSVTPEGFVCRNTACRRPIDDMTRAFGRWEHRYPERNLKGFRITQMMVPDIEPAAIYKKIQEYPTVRLYNEVLGRSYEVADKPFTEQLVEAMLDREEAPLERTAGVYGKYANRPTFLGIDWGEGEKNGKAGTGYTTMTVDVLQEDGVLRSIYQRRFERGDEVLVDNQIAHVDQLVSAFNIQMIVADYGGGFFQNQTLRQKHGHRFFQAHYVGDLKAHYTYDAEAYKYIVKRSKWITEYIAECKAGRQRINAMANPNVEWVKRNLKGVYAEYRISRAGRSEELFYGHPLGEPDDYLHAKIYAWMAMRIHRGELGSIVHQDATNGSNLDNLFIGAYGR